MLLRVVMCASPAAPVLRHFGQSAHLARSENAARRAQPQHERVLRGRDIKETVKLEAEDIAAFGKAVLIGMSEKLVPDIERVLLVLPCALPCRGHPPACRSQVSSFGGAARLQRRMQDPP